MVYGFTGFTGLGFTGSVLRAWNRRNFVRSEG